MTDLLYDINFRKILLLQFKGYLHQTLIKKFLITIHHRHGLYLIPKNGIHVLLDVYQMVKFPVWIYH